MLVLLRMHVRPVINLFFPTRITGPGLGRAEVTKHRRRQKEIIVSSKESET